MSFVIVPELIFAEIETDKSVYTKGEPVSISGIIDFQDDDRVNIVEIDITDFINDNTVVNEYTPIDNDNSFSRTYDSAIWPLGEYTVTVSYNDVEEVTEFEISDSSSNDDNDSSTGQQQSSNLSNVPDTPTNLNADVVSSTQVNLSWFAPENDDSVTGYKIEVSTTNTQSYSIVVENTESTDTTYSHTGLTPDTTYIYRVSAINDIGTSDSSSEAITSTLPAELEDNESNNTQQEDLTSQNNDNSESDTTTSSLVPSPPTDLKAIPVSQSRIDMSWSVPTDIGTSPLLGYKIESKTSNESDYSTLVRNTGTATTLTYSHTGLTAGLTYQYHIYAINSSGESNPSEVSEATIILNNDNPIDPQQPSTLQPVQVTLSTNKPVYDTDDSIEISGTLTSSIQDSPLGLRIIAADDTIVYVRSISVDNNNSFEVIIPQTQRQSLVWQNNGEFLVEITHNGRVQITTTFEINNGNTNTVTESDSNTQTQTESDTPQQPSSDDSNTQTQTESDTPQQPSSDDSNTQTQTESDTPQQPSSDDSNTQTQTESDTPQQPSSDDSNTQTQTESDTPQQPSSDDSNTQTQTESDTPQQPSSDDSNTQTQTESDTPQQPSSDDSNTQTQTESDTPQQPSSDDSNTQTQTESDTPQQPSSDDSNTVTSNNELENQNITLESANQQLQDENNQLKIQIDELTKRIEQLDAVVMEQIRVMMETLGALESGN